MTRYQVCSNCVMDVSDPSIVFDEHGVCHHCHSFKKNILPLWERAQSGREALDRVVEVIKRRSARAPYDCIIGLSGGLDSSYMLHVLATEYDLRPLVFHVDAGWNTEQAVHNINALVEKLGITLHTYVVDWEDVRDFQLALFKSGLPYLDIPQDHAFIATLYHYANKHGIKYIMNGGNFSTEGVRIPIEWLYFATDMALINDVRRRYCTRDLTNYPFSPVLFHKAYLRYVKGVQVIKPLNLIPYRKKDAENTLSELYGWKPFPQKHFESRFTRFFEGYWLPTRFGYDMRRVQYSSLILTGQMSRDEALQRLEQPPYDPETIGEEFAFVAKRLGITVEELRSYHEMPKRTYRDYRNQLAMFNLGARILKLLGTEHTIRK